MARQIRDSKIATRQARLQLPQPQNREPFWRHIHPGLHLGYRKSARSGVWMVRFKNGAAYSKKVLGYADDLQDSNGQDILSYAEALNKALEHAQTGMRALVPITVEKAAEAYLGWFKGHRKGYRETATLVAAHILPTLGSRLVSDLTAMEIRLWLEKLAATPARKRTANNAPVSYRSRPKTADEKRARKSSANRALTVLKAILNRAFQDEKVDDDTAWRRVKPFENADQPINRFLTEAECLRLINAAPQDFRLLINAALFTGARYTELTTLRKKDFNKDLRSIYIQPSKSGKGRYVPLSDKGFDFFEKCSLQRKPEEVIFQKDTGLAWGRNHQVRPLHEACLNAQIEPEIGFHELRHTYASLLAQKGADLLTISKLLGHSDTRITSRHYAHLCDKTLANTVNSLLPDFGHIADNVVQQFDNQEKRKSSAYFSRSSSVTSLKTR